MLRLLAGLLTLTLTGFLHAEDMIPDVGPTGPVKKLHTGFRAAEGPAADPEGNVYFTDILNERICLVDLDGKLSVFLTDSKKCNGLMFDRQGRLCACQSGTGSIIAIDLPSKKITVLAREYNGKPLKGPNDLATDQHGGIYFSDFPAKSLYYVSRDGKVSCLLKDQPNPNGVLLTPNGKTLYVLFEASANVLAYPVQGPGKIGTPAHFCTLAQPKGSKPAGGDGLTMDRRGNVYLTLPARKAIQVVSPRGKTLEIIPIPGGEVPSNCTFGGKGLKTLYVTTRQSLFAIPMNVAGVRTRFAK
jgi:gluconolactonase